MAFPFPSFPTSSSSSSASSFTISQEDFNLFHSIDRKLFTSLVVTLGRDPAESMQVMALWLWFERVGHCRNLIHTILPLPFTLINSLADEAVMCLTCIEQDEFPSRFENTEIVLTRKFAKNDISLRFFHGIRVTALRGVTQIVNDVCSRAFRDIMQNLLGNNQNPTQGVNENNASTDHQEQNVNSAVGQEQHAVYGPVLGFPGFGNPNVGFVPYVEGRTGGGILNVPQNIVPNAAVGPLLDPRAIMEGVANTSQISRAFDPYDVLYQRHILSSELSNLLGNINLGGGEGEDDRELVPVDDRTIFLTFSKGYPISEDEVRDFITRRHGDCIDEIYMQEVLPDEQVLYARLVVKSASAIDLVLGGQTKAKFSINGKHVWGRKYVRKPQPPAQVATSSSSQPTSPRATGKPN